MAALALSVLFGTTMAAAPTQADTPYQTAGMDHNIAAVAAYVASLGAYGIPQALPGSKIYEAMLTGPQAMPVMNPSRS